MNLRVRRTTRTTDAFLGILEVDGSFNCYSMENLSLAIPPGSYAVEITYSPHFHRAMPLLDGVLGRNEIRIHPANLPSQLEGCIAIGQSHDADDLDNSDAAFEPLFKLISGALARGESVTVEVTDETQPKSLDLPLNTVLPLPVPHQDNAQSLWTAILGMLIAIMKHK